MLKAAAAQDSVGKKTCPQKVPILYERAKTPLSRRDNEHMPTVFFCSSIAEHCSNTSAGSHGRVLVLYVFAHKLICSLFVQCTHHSTASCR